MEERWQLQEAKNKLSELVERAVQKGPQRITRHGKTAVVVLSVRDFDRIKGRKDSLVDFLRGSPLKDLELERDKGLARQVDL